MLQSAFIQSSMKRLALVGSIRSLASKPNQNSRHSNIERNTNINLAAYPLIKMNSILNFGKQGFSYVIEQFGKFDRMEPAGLFVSIPFIEKIYEVDMRQMVIDVDHLNAYTSDNVSIKVAAQLYLTVTDAKKSCYKVGQPLIAIMSKAQSSLRSAIGSCDLDHLLKDRNSINQMVNKSFLNSEEELGIKVIRFEITELSPDIRIQEAMDLQSCAERERRSIVIAAEGKKQAMELEADGKRRAAILEAEGLEKASEIISKISESVLHYNIKMKHIDMVGKLATNGKHSTYFVPKDISALPAMADIMKPKDV